VGDASYTLVVPWRRERVDPYPGPDVVWLFVERNRRTLSALAIGALLIVGGIVFAKYWHGGCGGTAEDRALVAELRDDPLLTAVPPGATSPQESVTYSCPRSTGGRRSAPNPIKAVGVEVTKQFALAAPMSSADLRRYFAASVDLGGWHLIDAGEQTLSYCRVVRSYRVVSLMTVEEKVFTNRILAWTDGRPCAPEVTP
jgi:hypothetical protein